MLWCAAWLRTVTYPYPDHRAHSLINSSCSMQHGLEPLELQLGVNEAGRFGSLYRQAAQ